MHASRLMSLSEIPLGVTVRVRELRSIPDISHRLREMGFCENAVLRCVQRGFGNVICDVCNTRIGLDAGLAGSILVTRVE